MAEAGPESAMAGFAEAWNRHDADALAALFADDATFVNVTGLWWNSRDRIRAAHAYGFERIFGSSHMRVGRTRTRMLSPHLAVVTSRLHVTGQVTPEGEQADDRTTVMTMVVEQSGGAWNVLSAQNTDVPPGGMETHINRGENATPARYSELDNAPEKNGQ